MKKFFQVSCCVLAITSLSACDSLPSWMGGRKDEKPKLEGERFSALPSLSKVEPDIALKNSAPKLPPVSTNSDWLQPTSMFNAASSNLSGGEFTNKNSATAGDGNDFESSLIPSPIIVGGTVYAMDAACYISAHDANDIGNVRWKSEVIADRHGKDVLGGGITFADDVLYAVSGDGKVAAINASDGKMIWTKNFSAAMRAAPRVSGDRLIVVTMDSQTFALSTKNGEILWDHRGINETSGVMSNVSPTVVNNGVLIPYDSGELFALSINDGSAWWSDVLLQSKSTQGAGVFTGIGGDPIIDGNIAFATSNNGVTAAINMANGQRVWQQQLASINTPWLAGDELFLLTADNVLVDMVKYTGKIRWATELESFLDKDRKLKPISWKGAVLVADKLLLTNSKGEIVFVSASDGKIIKTIDAPSKTTSAPVVAGRKLYLVGSDATLYSLQ